MKKLILASTSVYREKLLHRLGLPFKKIKPPFDEESEKKSTLTPEKLAQRLAFLKAESVLTSLPAIEAAQTIVIGSDQLVLFQGHILGKPLTSEKAFQHLKSMQNQKHSLITAVSVLSVDQHSQIVDITDIWLKPLSDLQIKNYIEKDQPLDCAGAYKFESSGIALIEKMSCKDPSAIEGLPLIALCASLKEFKYEPFQS